MLCMLFNIKMFWIQYIKSYKSLNLLPWVYISIAIIYSCLSDNYSINCQEHKNSILSLLLLAAIGIINALETAFLDDFNNGRIEKWIAEGYNLKKIFLKKTLAFFIFGIVPLIGSNFFIVKKVFFIPIQPIFFLSIGLSFVSWFFFGILLSALCIQTRAIGILLIFLMIPFIIPNLILSLDIYSLLLSNKEYISVLILQLIISINYLIISLIWTPIILRWIYQESDSI